MWLGVPDLGTRYIGHRFKEFSLQVKDAELTVSC